MDLIHPERFLLRKPKEIICIYNHINGMEAMIDRTLERPGEGEGGGADERALLAQGNALHG
jgi:hypothetical protein